MQRHSAMSRSWSEQRTISSLMMRPPVCVRIHDTVASVLTLLLDAHLHAAPVVDARQHLIGFVSLSDLAGAAYDEAPIDDVMTRLVISLRASSTVTMAAALMAYEGLRQLPIVDVENRVVGLLSALDVLRWLAQEDGYCMPSYTQRQVLR